MMNCSCDDRCKRHRRLDPIEQEYIRKIESTMDSDTAYELSIGLRQYREIYKVDE